MQLYSSETWTLYARICNRIQASETFSRAVFGAFQGDREGMMMTQGTLKEFTVLCSNVLTMYDLINPMWIKHRFNVYQKTIKIK